MYLSGFGNYHQTEAIAGALPTDQNSPQNCNLGLFPEQLSGSAFTRQRHCNLRSWLYRKQPSVVHANFELYSQSICKPFSDNQSPAPIRWSAQKSSSESIDFLSGITHIAGSANINCFIYQANKSQEKSYFNNKDGELLFVPYNGDIRLVTEFGVLEISPGSIAVIPRGVVFKIELRSATAAGYLAENKGLPLTLPQLGPIGANGLANPRHFLYPTAAFEDIDDEVKIYSKYQDKLWVSKSSTSPINVVAWHGNYAPYSYDLSLFNTINTVSFDHPDPSIFTVLTSESEVPGVANLDFVIFPPRWMVAENSFRPPYFHRNIMSELMGLVVGEYDAKAEGFEVGGISIHNCMTPHGPDSLSYSQAVNSELKPTYYKDTLAFMLETKDPWSYTDSAFDSSTRQENYTDCWQGF
ncbi:MAG: homogentisate 1,2-dioxygenase [Legionellaceae bacterium]|nr:homogentisate 1,2-dioxygenase [Legionellaceae bacterium]